MINSEKISLSLLVDQPFHYAVIENCISTSDMSKLLAQLPKENNYRSIRETGSDKTYNVVNNILLELGSKQPNHENKMSPSWLVLMDSLQSEDYISALSRLLNENLSLCHQEITLKRYGYQDFISPHTDKANVKATHMFFLNEEWDSRWGGELCFMQDSTTNIKKFLPVSDHSVVFVRSDCSWHAVDKITKPGVERIIIQVAFWNVDKRMVLDGRVEHAVDV